MAEFADLYGFSSDDLGVLAGIIARSQGIRFSPHESLYHGGNYYLGEDENNSVSFRLQGNRDLLESEPEDSWAEPEFTHYPSLLYVSGTGLPDEIEKAILATFKGGVALLRRDTLDVDSIDQS
jgi:hypothetical protein